MAVTNLTGYTFEFSLYDSFYFPYESGGATFNLNFTSHTGSFTSLTYYNYSMDDYTSLGRGDAGMSYGSTNVWDEYNEWSNINYATLVITGGVDVTNPEVIAWFQANGTLTAPITNLTGYTWVGNEDLWPEWGNSNEVFFIDFISDSTNFTKLYLEVYDEMLLNLHYDDNDNNPSLTQAYDPVFSGWTNSNFKTIIINGGTDVNNLILISRLKELGTLTPPPPPENIAEKLLAVNQIKQDIKVAIENKGVNMTGVDFGGYAGKINVLTAVVELTQAQYDAIVVYDDNTYYLIVEE